MKNRLNRGGTFENNGRLGFIQNKNHQRINNKVGKQTKTLIQYGSPNPRESIEPPSKKVPYKQKKDDLNLGQSAISNRYLTIQEKIELLNNLDDSEATAKTEVNLAAPIIIGTCLDMCPEKERYVRQQQNIISDFERNETDQFDHRKAVKEYDRCTADQREPLPHELRPTSVLLKTMNYLVNTIDYELLDRNSSWSKLYGFIWDRTRSIRKDISQQHLRNSTAIHIVETIARFHIFCAAHLCELPVDVFDAQLNDKNLTGCLQTIKEMYSDLKPGSCPNEPEFRAYMILMNLSGGQIHIEVQGFRDDIFNSPQVTLAIQFMQAFISKNYVRFFRLLEQADFLTSCVLHRYIVQIRLHAFTVINKSYGSSKSVEKSNPVTLENFTRLLGFENIAESRSFCERIGIKCITDGHIPMIVPDMTFTVDFKIEKQLIRKCLKLVDNKVGERKLSQIFTGSVDIPTNGGLVLEDCQMVSFDVSGRYIGTRQISAKKVNVTNSENPVKHKLKSKDDFQSDDETIDLTADDDQPKKVVSGGNNCFRQSFKTYNSGIADSKNLFKTPSTNLFGTPPVSLPNQSPSSASGFKKSLSSSALTDSGENSFPVTTLSKAVNLFHSTSKASPSSANLFSTNRTQASINLFSPVASQSTDSRNLFRTQPTNDSSTLLSSSSAIPNFKYTFVSAGSSKLSSPGSASISGSQSITNQSIPGQDENDEESVQIDESDDGDRLSIEDESPLDFYRLTDDDIEEMSQEVMDDVINCVDTDVEQTVTKMVDMERFKSSECVRIEKLIFHEVIRQSAVSSFNDFVGQCKGTVSHEIFSDLSREIIDGFFKDMGRYVQKKQHEENTVNLTKKRIFFKRWNRNVSESIRQRKSFVNLPAAPRICDDFSVCEGFRGSVRLISLDSHHFSSDNTEAKHHPVLCRLEQITDGLRHIVTPVRSRQSCVVASQTMSDRSAFDSVHLSYFIKRIIETKFIAPLTDEKKLLILLAKVDPTASSIISKYNEFVKKVVSVIPIESKFQTSLADHLKLPIIACNPMVNWPVNMAILFDKLGLSDNQQNHFFLYIKELLSYCSENDLSDLSFHHIRLLPWIDIVTVAISNKLHWLCKEFSDVTIEIRSGAENELEACTVAVKNRCSELDVVECFEMCKSHHQRVLEQVGAQSTSSIKVSKRSSFYDDLNRKALEYESCIKKLKEEFD